MSDISFAPVASVSFIVLVLLNLSIRFWLYQRQIRSVCQHQAQVPSAFVQSISLAEHQKAGKYTLAKMRLAQIELCVESAWLFVLTLGGGINLLYRAAQSLLPGSSADSPILIGLVFLALLSLASGLLDLPFSIYRQFNLEARFGFNRMTPALFISDLIRNSLVGALISLPIVAALLWLLQNADTYTWLWAWLAWMAFNALLLFLYPVLIAPLFNKFTPMPDSAHKTKLDALLQRCQFTASGLFVMDGSRRSAHANAYFTGFGRHRRVVLFDTLIEQLTPEQLEAVLAHEIGHYKRKHLPKRLFSMALISLALLWCLFQLLHAGWFYQGLGVADAVPATALALFSLVMPLCLLPLSPINNAVSRKHEYEADVYAADQAHAEDLVNALVTMYRENAATLTPDSVYSLFHDTHPPASLRIAHLQSLKTHHAAA